MIISVQFLLVVLKQFIRHSHYQVSIGDHPWVLGTRARVFNPITIVLKIILTMPDWLQNKKTSAVYDKKIDKIFIIAYQLWNTNKAFYQEVIDYISTKKGQPELIRIRTQEIFLSILLCTTERKSFWAAQEITHPTGPRN